MRVIGLTGGVGSGKSLAAHILAAECGAELLITDGLAHSVMEPGGECHRQIVEQYGSEIVGDDGRIDRNVLASKIFSDERARQELNAIVHPAVIRYVKKYIDERRDQPGTIVLESALLFEADCDRLCDVVWYVRVSEEARRKRLQDSRGYTQEKISAIMEGQLSEEEFIRRSDVVIDNDGTEEELREKLYLYIAGYLKAEIKA